jgi:hypothetical protein
MSVPISDSFRFAGAFLVLPSGFIYLSDAFISRPIAGLLLLAPSCLGILLGLFCVATACEYDKREKFLGYAILIPGVICFIVGIIMMLSSEAEYPVKTLTLVLFIPGALANIVGILTES